jgi:hypothetical protein
VPLSLKVYTVELAASGIVGEDVITPTSTPPTDVEYGFVYVIVKLT